MPGLFLVCEAFTINRVTTQWFLFVVRLDSDYFNSNGILSREWLEKEKGSDDGC